MISSGGTPLSPRIRESVERGTFVENLKEVRLRSSKEALQVLARGAANRRTATTFMNATSSRSHAVFVIRIEQVTRSSPRRHAKGGGSPERATAGERVCTSSLSLVDLAGSERQQKPGTGVEAQGTPSPSKATSATGGASGTGAGTGSSATVEATDFLSSTGRSTPASLPASFSRGRRRSIPIRESRELIMDDDAEALTIDQRLASSSSSVLRRLLCSTEENEVHSDGTETDCEEMSSLGRTGEPGPRRVSASVPQSPVARRPPSESSAPKGWDVLRSVSKGTGTGTGTRSATASPMPQRRHSLSGRSTPIAPPDDGSRLLEACAINKSLSALSGVILALNEERNYVPYRDSKLTLLLRDSIGGSARTWMVANVSPLELCMTETLSTIMYERPDVQRTTATDRLQSASFPSLHFAHSPFHCVLPSLPWQVCGACCQGTQPRRAPGGKAH